MRILHVYSGNLFGGVESMLLTFASTRSQGVELHQEFALCFKGRLSEELRSRGAVVHLLGGPPLRWSRPWSVLAARRWLRRLLAEGASRGGYDVVICHSPWAWGIFGPAVSASGPALVFWLHDVLSGRGWIEWVAARARPRMIVCGSLYSERSAKRGFAAARTAVIHCPVPAPALADPLIARARVRAELGIQPSQVLLLQASRMDRLKGHALFLEALGRLRADPAWTAVIAGGPQRESEHGYSRELREQAIALGLEHRVRFLDQRRDVAALMAAADVFVQPNLSPEGFGIAFVEALYAGLPVVTTAGGGAQEIVTPEVGVLIAKPEAGLLAHALTPLIGSEQVRKALGGAGPARARELSDPARQLARVRDLLSRAISPVAEGAS